MATANETDMSILQTDATFGNRVMISAEKYIVVTVYAEAITEATVQLHELRAAFGKLVLNNPTFYKPLFVQAVSANQTVANDATAGGTLVGMTAIQVAAAAATIPDTDIDNATAQAFNPLAGIG